MNLYIISQKSRGTVFGVGTYIHELTTALKSSGIRIFLVNILCDGKCVRKEEMEGITQWYFPTPCSEQWNFLDKEQRKLYFHNLVYLLRVHIRDRKELVFHLNHYQNEDLATELREAFDCKVISVSHSSDWTAGIHDNPQRLRAILKGNRSDVWSEDVRYAFEEEKADYMKMDRVICLSSYMQDLLSHDYGLDPDKIVIVPNGLNDATTCQSVDQKTLKKKWHIMEKERIILFVGRMEDIKGGHFLVRTFMKVLEDYPESRLMIIGDGNYDLFLRNAKPFFT